GAKKVIGVDLDQVSVRVSNENIKINQVEDIMEIRKGNLLEVINSKANIIVSNIIAEIIAKMTMDISRFLEDGGIFITSGIIIEKIYMVEEALIENGFKILEVKKMNSWACIIASKN
ncbi:MAG: 50S ribosomal protein L11 methyltransferase, partial [Tissierellia bacterium]|nr:50S ribosomal protein L11 methyltransferase [Tissierellia bacterium]